MNICQTECQKDADVSIAQSDGQPHCLRICHPETLHSGCWELWAQPAVGQRSQTHTLLPGWGPGTAMPQLWTNWLHSTLVFRKCRPCSESHSLKSAGLSQNASAPGVSGTPRPPARQLISRHYEQSEQDAGISSTKSCSPLGKSQG